MFNKYFCIIADITNCNEDDDDDIDEVDGGDQRQRRKLTRANAKTRRTLKINKMVSTCQGISCSIPIATPPVVASPQSTGRPYLLQRFFLLCANILSAELWVLLAMLIANAFINFMTQWLPLWCAQQRGRERESERERERERRSFDI